MDYEKQAQDFLNKNGIRFHSKYMGDREPLWCDDDKHIHGDRYFVTFSRSNPRKRFTLSFWNSFNDKQNGIAPKAYDVLSAVQKYDPGTFSNFCGDFGYDEDSRKAEKTYKLVVKEWRKVSAFFSETELEEAQGIN